MPSDCVICRGSAGDDELGRVLVWEDPLWRLTMTRGGQILGFAYLEPKRHVPYVTDLDGEEASTFGSVLARATRVMREESGAEVVYVYIFGDGVPHLHVHLAPHRAGDVLNDQMLRGEIEAQPLPNGFTSLVAKGFPAFPEAEHSALARRVRQSLASG